MPGSGQAARILLIEDNPSDVLLLRHALDEQHSPYTMTVLTDGEQALQFIEEFSGASSLPSVIVLDLHLPKFDGVVVLEALKQHASLSQVIIVVVTTISSPKVAAFVKSFGIQHYWRKPKELQEFQKLGGNILAVVKR